MIHCQELSSINVSGSSRLASLRLPCLQLLVTQPCGDDGAEEYVALNNWPVFAQCLPCELLAIYGVHADRSADKVSFPEIPYAALVYFEPCQARQGKHLSPNAAQIAVQM